MSAVDEGALGIRGVDLRCSAARLIARKADSPYARTDCRDHPAAGAGPSTPELIRPLSADPTASQVISPRDESGDRQIDESGDHQAGIAGRQAWREGQLTMG
jgi:hypothetical protein